MKHFTYTKLPHTCFEPAEHRGRVERINYPTKKYGIKHAYVYTPYGYDGKDMSTRYDILYLMHGMNSGVETFLWDEASNSHFKNMMDHMIEAGEISPLIVVTPTFYPPGGPAAGRGHEHELAKDFPDELLRHLMISVESMYLTYADSINHEGFRDSREHRMFGGFSMGGVITWYVLAGLMDCFSTFIPMSGDCWQLCSLGGQRMPEQTAQWLADSVRSNSFTAKDFTVYTATGTLDSAFQALKFQVSAMLEHPDVFRDGNTDTSGGNLFSYFVQGAVHDYTYAYEYLYSALRACRQTGDSAVPANTSET